MRNRTFLEMALLDHLSTMGLDPRNSGCHVYPCLLDGLQSGSSDCSRTKPLRYRSTFVSNDDLLRHRTLPWSKPFYFPFFQVTENLNSAGQMLSPKMESKPPPAGKKPRPLDGKAKMEAVSREAAKGQNIEREKSLHRKSAQPHSDEFSKSSAATGAGDFDRPPAALKLLGSPAGHTGTGKPPPRYWKSAG